MAVHIYDPQEAPKPTCQAIGVLGKRPYLSVWNMNLTSS